MDVAGVLQEAGDGNSRAHNCKYKIASIVTLPDLLDRWSSLCCYCKRWEDGKDEDS